MSRFEIPSVEVEAAELGKVTLRGLKFSERVALFEDTPSGPKFAANLLSMCASIDGQEALSMDDWDTYGGLHQDDYVSLVQAASRLAGFLKEEVEKK